MPDSLAAIPAESIIGLQGPDIALHIPNTAPALPSSGMVWPRKSEASEDRVGRRASVGSAGPLSEIATTAHDAEFGGLIEAPFSHNLVALLPSNLLSPSLPTSMPSQASPGLTMFATEQVRNDLTIHFYDPHANKTPRSQTPRPPPVRPPLDIARRAHESNADVQNGQHAGAREDELELAAGRTSVAAVPQRCDDCEGGSASSMPCIPMETAHTLAPLTTTVSSQSEEQDRSHHSPSQVSVPKSPIPGWRCWTSGDTSRISSVQATTPVSSISRSADEVDCGLGNVDKDRSNSISDSRQLHSQPTSDEESNEEAWSGVFQEETDTGCVASQSGPLHTLLTTTLGAECVPVLSHALEQSSSVPLREISLGINCSEKGRLSSNRARSVSSEDEEDEMPRRKRRQRSSQLMTNIPKRRRQPQDERHDIMKKRRPCKHRDSHSQNADYTRSSSRCSSASPLDTTPISPRTCSHDEPTWQVKRIVGRSRGFLGETIYLVEWKRTWEPVSGLSGCADAIAEYEESQARRTIAASQINHM